MKCLRCGHCCQNSMVIVVKDPEKPIAEDNFLAVGIDGQECPHLQGDTPGEYSCAIHDRKWYPETPCFSHGQIEQSPDDPCRTGEYLLKRGIATDDGK